MREKLGDSILSENKVSHSCRQGEIDHYSEVVFGTLPGLTRGKTRKAGRKNISKGEAKWLGKTLKKSQERMGSRVLGRGENRRGGLHLRKTQY